jgi:hypothetical protein
LEGYCIALTKPKRQTLPTSFCNNIVKHEKENVFKILIPCSLYDARHIDSKKWRYGKVLHIDVRKSLEQSYGV